MAKNSAITRSLKKGKGGQNSDGKHCGLNPVHWDNKREESMNTIVLAVILADICAIIGFVIGYKTNPVADASVLLEQNGTTRYGIEVPCQHRRSIFSFAVFVFTALGFIFGGAIGVIIGVALRLPWR